MRSQINGYLIGPSDPASAMAAAAVWTPARLSPLLWWRPDADAVTLVTGKVASCVDRGSLVAPLVQSTDAIRPTYVASGARNGRPCIEATATGQLLTAAGVTLPREVAIWIVTGTIATAGFAFTHLVGATRSHYLYPPGVAAFQVSNAAGSLYWARFSSWAAGKIANRGLLGIYDGTAIDVYSNNTNENGSTTGAAFASSNVTGTVGLFCSPDGVNPSVMQIYEAAVFPASSLTSSANRQFLRDYELARYG
jgi:hypothetical protein